MAKKRSESSNVLRKVSAEDTTISDDDEIYKHKPTSTLNVPTLFLLVMTISIAYYVSISDKTKENIVRRHSTNSNSNKTSSKNTDAVNRTLPEGPKGPDSKNNNNNVLNGKETIKEKPTKKKKSKRNELTNSYDKKIMSHIYDGEHLLNKGQYAECISFFENLLLKYSLSPRIIYGHAQCLHKLAEKMKSNALLMKAIESYGEVANKPDVPKKLLKVSLIEQSKQYIFLGHTRSAIKSLNNLIALVPQDVDALNELGVCYLILGSNKLALTPFHDVLKIDPDNGVAKVHIGFILKSELKYKECIPYLLEGIRSGEKAAIDSRFFFHLGDAYMRLGQPDKAWRVYHEGAEKKLFPSAEQRSMYNAESKLRAQPWWTPKETGYEKEIKLLEYHWKTIRDEALAIMNADISQFPLEAENLIDQGDWRQYDLYSQGSRKKNHCKKVPKTCAIIEKMPNAVNNKRGQIKFSVMQPGTHIWPHTGPTNCRLRMHLGLVIPKNVHIRVGSETKTWKNGKVIVIDDSFDHEVWHNGTKSRLIFIIDFWHPDLPQWEKDQLSPI